MSPATLSTETLPFPDGFEYAPELLTVAEERTLLEAIQGISLDGATHRTFTAKRRIVSYGRSYDFTHQEPKPVEPVPDWLLPLRESLATWTGVPAGQFEHALVAEYQPDTQLGWHRDDPDFDVIAGVSLAGSTRMRLRRYPHEKGDRRGVIVLPLAQRSAYVMRRTARWNWQHSISPTTELRYSITFRTRLA